MFLTNHLIVITRQIWWKDHKKWRHVWRPILSCFQTLLELFVLLKNITDMLTPSQLVNIPSSLHVFTLSFFSHRRCRTQLCAICINVVNDSVIGNLYDIPELAIFYRLNNASHMCPRVCRMPRVSSRLSNRLFTGEFFTLKFSKQLIIVKNRVTTIDL